MRGKPFKKGGEKPANSGRKAGTKNKTTQEIRDAIQKVMSMKMDELEDDLSRMNPFQQWQILEKVSKYFMPTMQRVEGDVEHTGEITIKIIDEGDGD